jgi:polyisoprenoid-binding protein YceI
MKTILRSTLAALVVLAAGAGVSRAQAHDWKIDPNHSEADFTVKHMAISTVHGTFHGVNGVIHFDPKEIAKSSVEATVDVGTVDTGVAQRDGHLKSADFFEVAKYPTMTFKSSSVRKAGDGYEVLGELTLHGVTKPVVLHLDAPGKEQVGMDGKSLHRGFVATTTINRQDFGVKWNGTLKSGDAAVSDEVKIELDVEAAAI